jgi:outer membrane protein assembly factor BamB
MAAGVAVACLVTAITIISGRPGTSSRPRASATPTTPATPSASVRWTYDTGGGVIRPAVAGGTVYIASDDGTVTALDAATGRLRWTYTPRSWISSELGTGWETYVVSGPAVAGGTVCISGDGTVFALDAATGRLRWTHTTADAVASSPAVAGGTVYIGGQDGAVFALDAGS